MVISRSLESQITHLHRLNNLLLISLCTPCLNTFHETLKKFVGLYNINVTSGNTKFQIFYAPSEKFTRECLFWVNICLKLTVPKKNSLRCRTLHCAWLDVNFTIYINVLRFQGTRFRVVSIDQWDMKGKVNLYTFFSKSSNRLMCWSVGNDVLSGLYSCVSSVTSFVLLSSSSSSSTVGSWGRYHSASFLAACITLLFSLSILIRASWSCEKKIVN